MRVDLQGRRESLGLVRMDKLWTHRDAVDELNVFWMTLGEWEEDKEGWRPEVTTPRDMISLVGCTEGEVDAKGCVTWRWDGLEDGSLLLGPCSGWTVVTGVADWLMSTDGTRVRLRGRGLVRTMAALEPSAFKDGAVDDVRDGWTILDGTSGVVYEVGCSRCYCERPPEAESGVFGDRWATRRTGCGHCRRCRDVK